MNRMLISPQLISLAAISGLVLAGVAVSFFTLWRAHTLLNRAVAALAPIRPSSSGDIDLLKREIQELRKQVQDTPLPVAPSTLPATPRSGLNLEKRSQALRLHRRGEAPAEIAATLDIPLQEVELLIKVHRIVLRSI
jgi:hypothetical protein